MRKFVAILLALTLIVTCVACNKDMTSSEFKAEFDKFNWENSSETAVNMEAERLLDMLEGLPSDTQKELSDIKVKLEEYKDYVEEKVDDMMPEDGMEDKDGDMLDDKDMDKEELMPEDGMEDIVPDENNVIE